MHIELDVTRCTGHGRCYEKAPELFDCDEDGHGVVRTADAPEELVPRARVAAENCPERAIALSVT